MACAKGENPQKKLSKIVNNLEHFWALSDYIKALSKEIESLLVGILNFSPAAVDLKSNLITFQKAFEKASSFFCKSRAILPYFA